MIDGLFSFFLSASILSHTLFSLFKAKRDTHNRYPLAAIDHLVTAVRLHCSTCALYGAISTSFFCTCPALLVATLPLTRLDTRCARACCTLRSSASPRLRPERLRLPWRLPPAPLPSRPPSPAASSRPSATTLVRPFLSLAGTHIPSAAPCCRLYHALSSAGLEDEKPAGGASAHPSSIASPSRLHPLPMALFRLRFAIR